jgi:nucleoside-diphosphate-sugar epimerase
MNTQQQHTALFTGATGFLGKHLCQQLLAQNWQVYALCRSQEKAQELDDRIKIIIGDILATDSLSSQLPPSMDAIFHIAASTNTWFKNNAMQTTTNLTGTQNMLDLGIELKVKRFIHVSSVVVFGIHSHLKNITEDMPKAGANSWINYVKTKTASEKQVLNCTNLDSVIINPTHIIGPGDKHNWARLIKMIAEEKLPSIPNGAGSFVDVRDVAAGIIAAFHHGNKGENYLLGGTDMDFKQFVHKVADKLKVKPTQTQLPNYLLMALAKIKNLVSRFTNKEPDITPESVTLISDLYGCDSAKAKAELNYQNRPIDVTLEETIEFLRQKKIIPSLHRL